MHFNFFENRKKLKKVQFFYHYWYNLWIATNDFDPLLDKWILHWKNFNFIFFLTLFFTEVNVCSSEANFSLNDQTWKTTKENLLSLFEFLRQNERKPNKTFSLIITKFENWKSAKKKRVDQNLSLRPLPLSTDPDEYSN